MEEYVIGSLDEETGEIEGWFNIPKGMFLRIEKMYGILNRKKNVNENCRYGVYRLVETEEGMLVEYAQNISEKFYRQIKYRVENGKPMTMIRIRRG